MEAVGFATGVLALAGLFNDAVECFQYVQLGRGFGTDFQTSLLRLDNAQLRLSRWGEAVRLHEPALDPTALPCTLTDADDIRRAGEQLGQILHLFAQAEGISNVYGRGLRRVEPNGLEGRADAATLSLHNKMREMSTKRQAKSPLRRKMKWALYDEQNFRRLIEDINALVTGLVELFPASRDRQRTLSEEDMMRLKQEPALPALKEIAAEQDADLDAALDKASSQEGYVFINHDNTRVGVQIHGSQHISGSQTFNL